MPRSDSSWLVAPGTIREPASRARRDLMFRGYARAMEWRLTWQWPRDMSWKVGALWVPGAAVERASDSSREGH
jgi:hypothetical protein